MGDIRQSISRFRLRTTNNNKLTRPETGHKLTQWKKATWNDEVGSGAANRQL
jgi:hypothetical protein